MMQNSPQSAHDFRRFWIGQTISNLGNSVTAFAVPLLIYKLTGSAFNLGLAVAIQTMPYLLFGLPIGAWVDRVDRKRLMIATDLARGALLASIPLLAAFGDLSIWWVYLVGFVNASVSIAFDAAQFAAVPSLVATDDLVTANGRIQASYSAATIVGPLIAGGLLALVPIERIFAIDAVSFVLSAASLRLVHRSFNAAAGAPAARTHIRHEIAEGLRYVASHPVLRTISIMTFLVNFVTISSFARLVLLAHERLGASDRQVGAIFSA
ncbi:MAG: MFS transporter, partial [Thermomicrobiales bacterium]